MHGAMSVGMALADGVLHLKFGGLVTPAGLVAFACEPFALPGPVHALLARFDDCAMAMSAGAFTELFDHPGVRDRFQPPAAVICTKADYALFDEHADQCAEIGIVRVAFTDVTEACAWTRRMVSVARVAELARLRPASPFRLRA